MKRGLLALALAALAAPAAGGAAPQDAGMIVFASNRTATLIPTEARAIALGTGRSKRVGVVPESLPASIVWSRDGRAFAYVDERRDLYVVRPGGGQRRIARRLGETDDRPSWSRSSRRIAFFGRDGGRLSVYLVNTRGGGLRRIARRIADAPDRLQGDGLAWSPDGRKLAIVSSRSGRYRLVVADVRTGRVRRLRTGRGVPTYPDWSPDGRRIAFRAQVPGERATVRTIDLETGLVRRVHRAGGIPRWAPNGRSLAVDEKHRLWVISNGAVPRLVATHPRIWAPPAWSPDSRRVVFMSRLDIVVAEAARRSTRRFVREVREFYPTNPPAWSGPSRVVYVGYRRDPGDLDLHVVREDGTGVRALTRNGVGEFDPAWSPDGRRIAYSTARGRSGSDVYVMNADGSGQRRVVADGLSPSWSPDGTRLAFERAGDIWSVGVDGSRAAQLTSGAEQDRQPDWSPLGDEIAFSRDPERATAEIYALEATTGALRRITFESAANVGCHFNTALAPSWSPDGRRIAYELETGGSSTCSPSRGHEVAIHVIDSNGASRRFVTNGGYQDVISDDGALSPTWSPDGTLIAFLSSIHDREPEYKGRVRIGLVASSGGPFRLITPKSYFVYSLDWSG